MAITHPSACASCPTVKVVLEGQGLRRALPPCPLHFRHHLRSRSCSLPAIRMAAGGTALIVPALDCSSIVATWHARLRVCGGACKGRQQSPRAMPKEGALVGFETVGPCTAGTMLCVTGPCRHACPRLASVCSGRPQGRRLRRRRCRKGQWPSRGSADAARATVFVIALSTRQWQTQRRRQDFCDR